MAPYRDLIDEDLAAAHKPSMHPSWWDALKWRAWVVVLGLVVWGGIVLVVRAVFF